MKTVYENERMTPVKYHAQVIVAGGGPAGVMAAIAAARKGADTLLIERANCAGGIWTSGFLSWMLDVTNKNGILRELMNRLEQKGEGSFARDGNFIAYPESVKLELDDMLEEAGVHVLYYTQVVDAICSEKRLTHVILESKAGREAAEAQIFIDATGDGDLSAFAGCKYQIGRDENGVTQPASLIGLMTGVHADDVREFNNTLPYLSGPNAKECLKKEMERVGITPSYSAPSFFHVAEDLWLVMTTHGYGVNALNPSSLSEKTIEGRREMYAQQEALRKLGGPWKKLRIIATAPYIGIRECRRVAGRYTVTVQDALEGKQHDDAVCRVTFGLDVHPLQANRSFYDETGTLKAKPFDIPLRALESADIDNLLLAGRLISGDFLAHSSYRVSGDAATLGEAAGSEAARRVLEGGQVYDSI